MAVQRLFHYVPAGGGGKHTRAHRNTAESQDIWDWLFQWDAEVERAIRALLLDIWALATTHGFAQQFLGNEIRACFRERKTFIDAISATAEAFKRLLFPLYGLGLGLDLAVFSREREQLETYIKFPAALPLPGQSNWRNSVLSVSVCKMGSRVWPTEQVSPYADANPSKLDPLHSEGVGIWNLIHLSSDTSRNVDCLVYIGFHKCPLISPPSRALVNLRLLRKYLFIHLSWTCSLKN